MAKLRAVYPNGDYKDHLVTEGEQYRVAKEIWENEPSILYFFYWQDKDLNKHQFYTYPIEREDIDYLLKTNAI